MKKFLTIAIVAAGLAGMSTAASAHPNTNTNADFPTWAQNIFNEMG